MTRKKSPIDKTTRNREAARKARAKLKDQGRRLLTIHVSEAALAALDQLCDDQGLDRGRVMDNLL